MNRIIISIFALVMVGCSTLQTLPQILGTPQAVQTEISLISAAVKPYIPSEVQAKIHNFAVQVNSSADLNLDQLFKLLPATTGSQNGDYLLGRIKDDLTFFVNKYGSKNGTTLSYAHAIANGLLSAFTLAMNDIQTNMARKYAGTNSQSNLRYVERVSGGESREFTKQLKLIAAKF